ncbi:MAG: hypothetical protein Q9214_006261 [Letrouitia sp. 1 TL-2023]
MIGLITSTENAAVMLSSVWAAYIVFLIFSRLFFHPLKNIPGPKLAALTSWYEFYYDAILPGQFVWQIKKLHQTYGPIIRITPWEIHINDVNFLDDIYPASYRPRDKYPYQTRTLPVPLSIGGTIKHDLHRKRREALNPFFSKRSVQNLGPMIASKVQLLCNCIDSKLKVREPVNLSDLYFALSNDIVSQYSFGFDEDLLRNLARASNLRSNLSELLLGVKFNQHFPWLVDALEMLPMFLAKRIMPPGVLDMKAFSTNIRQLISQVLNDTEDASRRNKQSVFYELRDSPTLPVSEKSLLRLEHEGTLLVMAGINRYLHIHFRGLKLLSGTESTAKSMAIIHFHLLANPAIMSKLRSEVRTVPETASWSELEQLPYLSACIAEGNRLSFGVTARACRIAPNESLSYKGHLIPPGTPVSMTSLCVHTDEHVFPDPWTFNPDRWLGSEGVARRKYQLAFQKGGRNCIGINLAHAELFVVIARIVRYEMALYQTDLSDVTFQHDYQVAYPKLDSKGVQAIVKERLGSI